MYCQHYCNMQRVVDQHSTYNYMYANHNTDPIACDGHHMMYVMYSAEAESDFHSHIL